MEVYRLNSYSKRFQNFSLPNLNGRRNRYDSLKGLKKIVVEINHLSIDSQEVRAFLRLSSVFKDAVYYMVSQDPMVSKIEEFVAYTIKIFAEIFSPKTSSSFGEG